MIEKRDGYSDDKYLIYYAANEPIPAISNSYLGYIARYKLLTSSIKVITEFDRENMLKNLPQYDYLIVVEVDSAFEAFISEFVDKKNYRGVYLIEQTF